MVMAQYPTRQLASPLTPRGFVIFVKIRPHRTQRAWVCDECIEHVSPAQQPKHALEHE